MSVKWVVMNDTEHVRKPLKPETPGVVRCRDAEQDSISRGDAGSVSDGPGDVSGPSDDSAQDVREIGGRKGPDPVRYGDWEKNGRCIDF